MTRQNSLLIALGLLAVFANSHCATEQVDVATEVDDERGLQNEIAAFLEVETLMQEIGTELIATGDEQPASFLENSVTAMSLILDQHQEDNFKPESSHQAATRGQASNLMKQLIAAYHNAVLGEFDQLKQASTNIGTMSVRISKLLGVEFMHLTKYLAALYDLGQRHNERETDDEPNWFSRFLASIGLKC